MLIDGGDQTRIDGYGLHTTHALKDLVLQDA